MWSISDDYINGCRNSTITLLFKAMIFLHLNRKSQNEKTIAKALKIAKEKRMAARASAIVVEDNVYAEMREMTNQSSQNNRT